MAANTLCEHYEQQQPAQQISKTYDDEVSDDLSKDVHINTDAEDDIDGLANKELDVANGHSNLRLDISHNGGEGCLRAVVLGDVRCK